MATLTAQPPLVGGGDMATDLTVGVLDASSNTKGVLKLSVGPADPVNPIAWGQNDSNVEVTSNKVTSFSAPTNNQYPSALLVSNVLAGKVAKAGAVTPGTVTKVTVNADGLVVGTDNATTTDITEVSGKRYVTDTQQTALTHLSGVNSGDQDLSVYALQSSLDATNENLEAFNLSMNNYALASDLTATNATVDGIVASLPSYALASDLAATNAHINAINTNLTTNYTLKVEHDALETSFNNLVTGLSDPSNVDSTAFESKLTFESGLTRVGDVITNDAMTVQVGPHMFLGNQSDAFGVATFVQPNATDLIGGVTGTGKVVLDSFPVVTGPTMLAPVTALLADDGVSTSPSIFVIDHEFIGGGSIIPGFGTTLEFRARSSNVANRTQGAIRTVWTTATDGSRTSNMVLSPVFNGVAVDTLWLHGDGSMALGANIGYGVGLFHAQGGFSTAGVGTIGQVLVDNGVKFVPGRLDAANLTGQFASCPITKYTTTDQTATAEQTHFSIPILPGAIAGTTWRIIAWGNMDHGSSSVTFVNILRWGGLSGTILAQSHNVVTPGSTETNMPWKVEFLVMITSIGALGTARTTCSLAETMTNNPKAYLGLINSGGTDVTPVNTTINTTMSMGWTISGTSGAPHVRTFGAFAELVCRPVPAST